MRKTLKIPGRFRYRADAVPKGARNPRRIFLHAPLLLEIAVAGRDAVADAVAVRTYDGKETSYLLHDGRLWRPADGAAPVTAADYATMANAWPTVAADSRAILPVVLEHPLRALVSDPVAAAVPFGQPMQWPARGGGVVQAEEDFSGRLLTSDRDESRDLCLAAAADVVEYGGLIHFAAPDPVWETSYQGPIRMIAPQAGMDAYSYYTPQDGGCVVEGWRSFSVRRLADAAEFAAGNDPTKPHPIEGAILHADDRYVPPPAMARAVQDAFHYLLRSDSIYPILRHMTPDGVTAFGALQGAAASLSSRGLGALGHDPGPCVAALRTIRNELTSRLLPVDADLTRNYILRNIAPILDRAAFEASPRPTLTAEEDVSLSSVAAAPRHA
jgi:hypothetical protein